MIEAITEDAAAKEDVFRRATALPQVLASNTSSIPITALAAAAGRADRVDRDCTSSTPCRCMKLVEVIRAIQTSEREAIGRARPRAGKDR